jgi:DNA topoisomerase-1
MCDFASRLGVIRARCQHYLRKRGLPREKVLAALVRVVDLTAIRVGHEEYARANNSFGLTTLRVRHVRIRGATVELSFRGKSGIQRRLQFQDRALAQVFTRCRALGGGHMFKFNDEQGRQRRVTAEHVNAFLRELLGRNGHHYSIKDFRTWSATVRVAVELAQSEPAASQRAMRKQLLEAVRKGAEHLGNTAAICRKSYVHPLIFEAYAQGRVVEVKAEASLLAQEDSVRRFLLSLMQPAAVARASR